MNVSGIGQVRVTQMNGSSRKRCSSCVDEEVCANPVRSKRKNLKKLLTRSASLVNHPKSTCSSSDLLGLVETTASSHLEKAQQQRGCRSRQTLRICFAVLLVYSRIPFDHGRFTELVRPPTDSSDERHKPSEIS